MKHIDDDISYSSLVSDILTNEVFKKLEIIKHHDSNRLDHSLKVSYYSYIVARKLGLDYKEVARGGLLHDFYLNRTVDYRKFKDKFMLYTTKHPQDALENAEQYFSLSSKEKDIIRTHMFPIDIKIPKYMESWIVNIVDTVVSTCEFTKKFSFQLRSATTLFAVFVINIIKL